MASSIKITNHLRGIGYEVTRKDLCKESWRSGRGHGCPKLRGCPECLDRSPVIRLDKPSSFHQLEDDEIESFSHIENGLNAASLLICRIGDEAKVERPMERYAHFELDMDETTHLRNKGWLTKDDDVDYTLSFGHDDSPRSPALEDTQDDQFSPAEQEEPGV